MFRVMLSNFHLEKILWILKSKFLYVFFGGLLFAICGGVYAELVGTSIYRASTSLYVYSSQDYVDETEVNISSADFSTAKSLLSSYMLIVKSSSFLNKVIEDQNLTGYTVENLQDEITATAISNTAMLTITVIDSNPYNAMNIANAIGKLAPDEIVRIVKSGGIEVVDEAQLPTAPYSTTSAFLYSCIGFVAGFMLMLFVFLLKGLQDTRIRRTYELIDMFTIPILGTVPWMEKGEKTKKRKEKKENADHDVLLSEKSPFILKEAYNDIRTDLLFMGQGKKCPIFAVISPDDAEGKTYNSYNIALAYAQMNKKVLLIDADLRKSTMAEMLCFEQNDDKGLSHYLAGIGNLNDLKRKKDGIDVILAGTIPPNPAELLTNDNWKKLLEESQNEYDAIFIDLPSAGIVADGLLMADVATAYILIVREFHTHFERVEMIVRKLESLGANICGFVYNGISTKSQDYNYRAYANGKEYGKA